MGLQFNNEYGEKIKVKLENGVILVHHDDITDSFITLDELKSKYVLEDGELDKINKAISMIPQINLTQN